MKTIKQILSDAVSALDSMTDERFAEIEKEILADVSGSEARSDWFVYGGAVQAYGEPALKTDMQPAEFMVQLDTKASFSYKITYVRPGRSVRYLPSAKMKPANNNADDEAESAAQILHNGFRFQPGCIDDGWFGPATYFWEEDLELARWWVTDSQSPGFKKVPAIIKAELDLTDGYLDLAVTSCGSPQARAGVIIPRSTRRASGTTG